MIAARSKVLEGWIVETGKLVEGARLNFQGRVPPNVLVRALRRWHRRQQCPHAVDRAGFDMASRSESPLRQVLTC